MTAEAPRLRDYLEHMLLAIQRVQRYTVGVDFSVFSVDEKTQDAVPSQHRGHG
jgi:uncharacterized protein with HEPN domain